jgi:outer membrane protein assembly factor BamB
MAWVKDGVKYVLNCGEKLTCVDPKTGEVKWQAPGPGCASASPCISGDYVVINYGEGRGTYAYKMSADKAEEIWHNRNGDRGASQVISDGYVYGFYKPGRYFCHKLETGEQKWMVQMGGGECCTPVMVDGKLFGFANDGGNTLYSAMIVFLPTPDKYTQYPVGALFRRCHRRG